VGRGCAHATAHKSATAHSASMPSFGTNKVSRLGGLCALQSNFFPVLIQKSAWSVYDFPFPVPTHICMCAFLSKTAVHCLTACSCLCKHLCKHFDSNHAYHTCKGAAVEQPWQPSLCCHDSILHIAAHSVLNVDLAQGLRLLLHRN